MTRDWVTESRARLAFDRKTYSRIIDMNYPWDEYELNISWTMIARNASIHTIIADSRQSTELISINSISPQLQSRTTNAWQRHHWTDSTRPLGRPLRRQLTTIKLRLEIRFEPLLRPIDLNYSWIVNKFCQVVSVFVGHRSPPVTAVTGRGFHKSPIDWRVWWGLQSAPWVRPPLTSLYVSYSSLFISN